MKTVNIFEKKAPKCIKIINVNNQSYEAKYM